ncbi:hypothetical protein OB955_12725 [Halobacteria archaeon AArc-m2/3/4]|uniref:Halobacterial output domain-containing protein n=1 Tax=Natronoglomus mannanivorans TaxID=2979990 RepID=A0ABT2QF97_9EURY|nr:hypothetical protein [Halobacteria archaeon AArc-m2/3/4]
MASDETTEYDDAVAVSDGPPRQMWVRVDIDGQPLTDEASDFPDETIHIVIDESENVTVSIDSP